MKKLAPFLVLIAGILWGLIGIFIRGLDAAQLDSMDIVMLRAVVTSVLLFVYLFFTNREMLKIRLKDLWCFLGTGLCSIVFFNYCYFKTITLTSLAVAAVLLYTAPAIVMILSVILFREKITAQKLIAIVATFIGCILVTGIVGDTLVMNIKGILIGLGAGLGYALYSIFSRYALDRGYESLTISFYTFTFAMIGTLPFCRVSHIVNSMRDGKMFLFAVIFGLLSTVIPYITYTTGLKDMENSRASIIASIEPVTASVLGILVYHEKISLTTLIGVILVLGSIVISNCENVEADVS